MLKIKQNIIDDLIAHAQADTPIESCGYLAGKDGVITHNYRLTNIDNSPEHFSFDPQEQFATIKKVREENIEIIGNYHSHPETPARPSQEDIKLAYDPNIYYFIVSLATDTPTINAYKIVSSQVEKIKYEII